MPAPQAGGHCFMCRKENSKLLQVHVTFMGHYNFSNIFYVNVIMRYLGVAISSDKLSFSVHLGHATRSHMGVPSWQELLGASTAVAVRQMALELDRYFIPFT
jgi:hypothetical protein